MTYNNHSAGLMILFYNRTFIVFIQFNLIANVTNPSPNGYK